MLEKFVYISYFCNCACLDLTIYLLLPFFFQSSVTNALRETLLSFGGTIATKLLEQLENNRLESQTNTEQITAPINHPNVAINGIDVRNVMANSDNNQQKSPGKDYRTSSSSSGDSRKVDSTSTAHIDKPQMSCTPRVKPMEMPKAAGMPPLLPQQAPPNVSYVVQRVLPPLYNATPPPLHHSVYYTHLVPTPPWPLTYDNFNRNGNSRCNVPPNFVINTLPNCSQSSSSGQSVSRGFSPPGNNVMPHSVNINSSWIKPSIFYDGFWTEQKVKNWVTEQNDKEYTPPVTSYENRMCHSKV